MRLLSMLMLWISFHAYAAKPDLLKLRPVVSEATSTSEKLHTADGEWLFVEKAALVDGTDLTHADVTVTEGQIVLNVSVRAEAGARLREYTARHVGDRIAFLIDGVVFRAPKINDPILVDGFLIGPFTRERAEELARRINE